jgi:hypothetical protein
MNWFGLTPAMTTAFDEKLNVDHIFMSSHARVRQPRLEIAGDELAETKRIVFEALKPRPKINEIAFAHAVR